MGRQLRGWVFVVALLGCPSLWAQSSPAYSFDSLAIGGTGSNNFVGMHMGSDMLPYTDDDVAVPNNPSGYMENMHFDSDGNGVVDPGESIFIAADGQLVGDDNESQFYSSLSRPEYGVIYESEDWVEVWEANQAGPNGDATPGDPTLTDFEINDWDGWGDESNAYTYNNLGQNQHANDTAQYRVDFRQGAADGVDNYDEIEGWKKTWGLRNTADDPTTDFVENGGCRRFQKSIDEINTAGYLVPTADLDGLKDGQFDTLFGWEENGTIGGQPIDLAAYLRDVIQPKLSDPDVFAWNEGGLTTADQLPFTHLFLEQTAVRVNVAQNTADCTGSSDPICAGAENPGLCQVMEHAAYWGLVDGVSLIRRSAIRVASPALATPLAGYHAWADTPGDDAEQNLWIQDQFWRDDNTHFGRYEIAGNWTIIEDPAGIAVDQADNEVAVVDAAGGGLSAPISRLLTKSELPITVTADIAEDERPAVGGGLNSGNVQIIVRTGNNVVAYADISTAQTQVFIGGVYDETTGNASGGVAGEAGLGAFLGILDDAGSDPSRYSLVVGADGARLLEAEIDEEPAGASGEPGPDSRSNYELRGVELASAAGDAQTLVGSGVSHATVSGPGGTAVDSFLVFASPGVGPFERGRCNDDGSVNIADPTFLLNFLFAPNSPEPKCKAACNANGDLGLDISDAVYELNFLFGGGAPLPTPAGSLGFSQSDGDNAIGCDTPQS